MESEDRIVDHLISFIFEEESWENILIDDALAGRSFLNPDFCISHSFTLSLFHFFSPSHSILTSISELRNWCYLNMFNNIESSSARVYMMTYWFIELKSTKNDGAIESCWSEFKISFLNEAS